MINESHVRSFIKGIIYRVLAVVSMTLLSLYFGATMSQALSIGSIVVVLGIVMYYAHERVWLLSSWGRSGVGNDSVARSVIKTITYRFLTMIVTVVMAKLIMTASNSTAVELAILQAVINTSLFFIIERISNKIKWGVAVV